MTRDIPEGVRRQLRAEVGFGCPVEGCASPYLTYHHFDPPWREREHHEPAGMIALCREHHDKAEGGAFTKDQLRALKCEGAERNRRVAGEFDWRRRQLLVHIGQTLMFEAAIPLAFNGVPVVSLTRNHENELLLSVNMLTTSMMPRLHMFENEWVSAGNPTDIESPPFGRKLRASYANGDRIAIEFKSVEDPDDLAARLPHMDRAKLWSEDLQKAEDGRVEAALEFPAVLVDVELELPDAGVSISADGTKTPMFKGNATYGAYGVGVLSLGHVPAPYPTMTNAVGISVDRPEMRFASMNDSVLWSLTNRSFRRMAYLLDGFDFRDCTFEECWIATRGQPFGLQNCSLGVSLWRSDELTKAYYIMRGLAEIGVPSFVEAGERIGQAAAKGREARKIAQ